eukprot:1732353-Alexandrium_andersonii.AAC.1
MSASLVGSEMCIRDRSEPGLATLVARIVPPCAARESASAPMAELPRRGNVGARQRLAWGRLRCDRAAGGCPRVMHLACPSVRKARSTGSTLPRLEAEAEDPTPPAARARPEGQQRRGKKTSERLQRAASAFSAASTL